MTTRIWPSAVLAILLSGCNSEQAPAVRDANTIALNSIIVDTHIDVPFRLNMRPDDVSQGTASGDFDYPRAVRGGLNAAFMSIYTPSELEAEGTSKQLADSLIDVVENIVSSAPGKFALAKTPGDVREQFAAGLISLPLGMENGSPLESDLGNLEHFFDRGIRYITLTHGKSNHIADSSYDDNHQWDGLSDFGVDVVREMNRLGIMVDISHVSDAAFWQVMDVTAAPAIASHSSARHFTPGFERNLSDDMIVALAKNGGVVMINFGSSFITAEANEYMSARSEAALRFKEQNPEYSDRDMYTKFPAIYAEQHGDLPYASVADVLDHIEHVVNLVGVDHVGIGSDYDGVGDSLPVGLKDVSSYPNLVQGLLDRGYSEADIRKVLGENLLRVWQQVIDYAATTYSKT